MKGLAFVAASAALVSTTVAHGGVLWYQFAGTWYKGYVQLS
jgi:hypothetical protein